MSRAVPGDWSFGDFGQPFRALGGRSTPVFSSAWQRAASPELYRPSALSALVQWDRAGLSEVSHLCGQAPEEIPAMEHVGVSNGHITLELLIRRWWLSPSPRKWRGRRRASSLASEERSASKPQVPRNGGTRPPDRRRDRFPLGRTEAVDRNHHSHGRNHFPGAIPDRDPYRTDPFRCLFDVPILNSPWSRR